jgi:hypothetical protein
MQRYSYKAGNMQKKHYFLLLFYFILFNSANARSFFKTDSLLSIFEVKESNLKVKLLVKYIKDNLLNSPNNELYTSKTEIEEFLNKYNEQDKDAYKYFNESIYQQRLFHVDACENNLIKAIQSADKNGNYFLSYTFLSYLANIQAEEGDVVGAVSSYRIAKKNAIKLNDTNLQMIIDIAISDVYYKNNIYSLSLFYLNQAEAIGNKFWPDDQRVKNSIYYNKSEIFFRMKMMDSLVAYNQKLKNSKANTYKLYTYKNRTDCYLYLLQHNYGKAINLIHKMRKDEGYKFEDADLQNLSDAYYKNGQLDSAKFIITQLLSRPSETNHPEIKYHLYNVLGKIAEQKSHYKSASGYFKLSLQQSEDNMNRLNQVGNISSLIKADEIEGYYSQKNETYRTERAWLIVIIIFALLIILIIAMFYRTIKQKRHYEKLLFATTKEELAFLNSHDVRKYLTNILGLIEVIKLSENKEKEYLLAEDYLFTSAEQLDEAIKNISQKLDD